MTVDEVNQKLKSLIITTSTNQIITCRTNGDETYGLNLAQVQGVAKEIKMDACLADELYGCNNLDLKLLATLIDDPKSYTLDELEKRSEQLYPSAFADKFCEKILAQTEFAVHFVEKWCHSENDNLKVFAYNTLSEIAKGKNCFATNFFARYQSEIEFAIKGENEMVRMAMIHALEKIGERNEALKAKSIQIISRTENSPPAPVRNIQERVRAAVHY